MSKPFNRGEIGQSLMRYLGMKGTTQPPVDELVSPTLNLGDLENSPYLKVGVPVGRMLVQPAVAASYSWVWAQPARTLCLQITRAIVSVSVASAVDIRLATNAQTTASLVPVLETVQWLDLGAAESSGPTSAWAAFRSSTVRRIAAGGANGGSDLVRLRLLANEPFEVNFPGPGVCLWGNDPDGPPALAFVCLSPNVALDVSLFGREWPLPG